MRRGSVKRPVLIYCMIFMVGLALSLVTYANAALFRSARRTHSELIRTQVETLCRGYSPQLVEHEAKRLLEPLGVETLVITSTTRAPLDYDDARLAALESVDSSDWIAVRVATAPDERYLAYRVDTRRAIRGARGESAPLVWLGILSSLIAGLLLYVMILRLMMPQLSTLQRIASDAVQKGPGLPSDDVPNEVAEIARAFRSNVRALREERETIAAQHDELERMQSNLVRASKLASIGRLAAGIAHEIGNPLSAVLGYLSLLKSPDLSAEERSDIIERSSKQLDRIHETIRKLLTYARPDEHGEELESFGIAAIVEETTHLLRSHPSLRGIDLQNEVLDSHTPDALGHPRPLEQVLVNLVLNAAHACHGLTRPFVRIHRRVTDAHVELSVDDNGPGVAPEEREQIFDPFFTTKPPGEGTGLGLAISRSIIEAMDGDLFVTDSPEGGARFTIRLLRSAPAGGDRPAEPS